MFPRLDRRLQLRQDRERSRLGYVFVNTADEGSIGWIEKLPDGSRVPYDRRSQIGANHDRRFRAFDSKTAKELWLTKLDYSAICVPMTHRGKNDKQYVVVVTTGAVASRSEPR